MRHFLLVIAKICLPLAAVALLALVALWPEITRMSDSTRLSFRRLLAVQAESGRMMDPHYRGVDERGRPYTLTATWASQAGPSRIDLGTPKGDMVLENGAWLQAESKRGVFLQHSEELDLSGDVVLYRDDGIVMRTEAAALDLKHGAASSTEMTHAEGPFGVLDSQGFTMIDKGTAIQFQGPARLIMNESKFPPTEQARK